MILEFMKNVVIWVMGNVSDVGNVSDMLLNPH